MAGHVARMKEDRLPNQLMFGTIQGSGRITGLSNPEMIV